MKARKPKPAPAPDRFPAGEEHFTAKYTNDSPLGRIVQLGHLRANRGVSREKPRVLGSYAFVYVYAGSGRYWDTTGLDVPVAAGDLIILFPTLGHAYGPMKGETWSEVYAVFDGPVFDLWEKSGLLNPAAPIHRLHPIDYWLPRFNAVIQTGRTPGPAPSLIEVCLLQRVLAEALTTPGPEATDVADRQWAAKACALLEADLSGALDIEELAARMDISYELFRKRFRQIVGLSPAQYRARRTIDLACELIRAGELRHKQIASRLGFADEYHFSKRFKKITGRSPRQFKNDLPRAG